jgi:hypothetical protein
MGLLWPPAGPDISIMWLMELYSLRTTKIRGTDDNKFLSNSSVWPLPSTTSQYLAWDLMVSKSDSTFLDQQLRLICQPVPSTDGLECSLFATGIAACIGEKVNPLVALLDRHVQSLLVDLEETYLSAHTPLTTSRKPASAGLSTLLLWMGWLRSSDMFDIYWSDFDVVEPVDGPTVDLPLGCGIVGIHLGPKTKTSCDKPVNMSMAYQLLSGYLHGLLCAS